VEVLWLVCPINALQKGSKTNTKLKKKYIETCEGIHPIVSKHVPLRIYSSRSLDHPLNLPAHNRISHCCRREREKKEGQRKAGPGTQFFEVYVFIMSSQPCATRVFRTVSIVCIDRTIRFVIIPFLYLSPSLP